MSSVLYRLSRLLRTRMAAFASSDRYNCEDSSSDSGTRRRRATGADSGDRESAHGGYGERTHDSELAGYYANLEIPYGADFATVCRVRKRLIRKYHPDLHAADPRRQQLATQLVQGLNQAFEGLRKHLVNNGR